MTRIISTLAVLFLAATAAADEGMWTIDNFPADAVAGKYDVSINDRWLHNAQLATTRLENGCTGSFASADGLVLTNNHCTWSCIRNLSTAERNLSDEGFMARTRDEELRCPGQQISVLVDYEDVTGKITRYLTVNGVEDTTAELFFTIGDGDVDFATDELPATFPMTGTTEADFACVNSTEAR